MIAFLNLLLSALQMLVFIRVLLSWIPIPRDNSFVGFIVQVTDPLLAPARAIMDHSIFGGKGSMLDFSPLIVFMVLSLVQRYLLSFGALL